MTKKINICFYIHFYKKDSFLVSPTCFVKILHKHSNSRLSNMLSCKDLLYKLSKDLIVCWSLSYCFLYLLFLFMIISYINLLPIDNPHAVAVEIGITIIPIPVRLKLIELDVVAIITNVSNDLNIVVFV